MNSCVMDWKLCQPGILLVLVAFCLGLSTAVAQENKLEKIAGAPPGINEGFVDPELDVDEWVARFELESREIYASRNEIIKHVGPSAGQRVADVGAGTGFFTQLFATAVGENGQVYAVDISTRFLEHIAKQSEQAELRNISPVLASASCCNLPPGSVDAVFICDTYHHFEQPGPTLQSIARAMVPGGKLYLIDFERIPGQSRPWLLDHVRADKQTFRKEVESAGLQFVEEIRISTFAENYFLVFCKPE